MRFLCVVYKAVTSTLRPMPKSPIFQFNIRLLKYLIDAALILNDVIIYVQKDPLVKCVY